MNTLTFVVIIVFVVITIITRIMFHRSSSIRRPEGMKEQIPEEGQKIREDNGFLQDYVDGLPQAKDPAIRNSFKAGYSAMKENKLIEAMDNFSVASAQAQESQKVALLTLMGNCLYRQGKLDDALGHYKEALDLAIQISDKDGEIANLSNIGVIYKTRGKLDEAMGNYKEALKLATEMNNTEGIAATFGNIGLVFQSKGELDSALEYYEVALKLHQGMENKDGTSRNLCNMATAYEVKGERDKALDYYNQSLKIFRQIGANREIEFVEEKIRGLSF